MRTDIHKPSAIKPEDYTFVAFQYYGGSDLGAILAMKVERERLAEHMGRTGGKFSGHEHGGLCHVCGQSNISYATVFYHAPSNSYIITGEDCARNIESQDMTAFRRAIQSGLEAQAGKQKAAAILAEAGLSAAWELYSVTIPALRAEAQKQFEIDGNPRGNFLPYEELTIEDMVRKLVKYGSISPRATDYLKTLLGKIAERPALEQKKAEEQAAAADCPTGRVEIIGTVLGFKEKEGWGGRMETKVLIQAESGFKVFGSRFASIEKGDKVRFTATVQPSKDDSKFGFFKRPAKSSIVWAEESDNDEMLCPSCEGQSSMCGLCGGTHKVAKGTARRAGMVPEAEPVHQEAV